MSETRPKIESEIKPEQKLEEYPILETSDLKVSGFMDSEKKTKKIVKKEKKPPFLTTEYEYDDNENLKSVELKDKEGKIWYLINLSSFRDRLSPDFRDRLSPEEEMKLVEEEIEKHIENCFKLEKEFFSQKSK